MDKMIPFDSFEMKWLGMLHCLDSLFRYLFSALSLRMVNLTVPATRPSSTSLQQAYNIHTLKNVRNSRWITLCTDTYWSYTNLIMRLFTNSLIFWFASFTEQQLLKESSSLNVCKIFQNLFTMFFTGTTMYRKCFFFFFAQNRKLHMHALFLNMLNVDLLHTLREDIVHVVKHINVLLLWHCLKICVNLHYWDLNYSNQSKNSMTVSLAF